MKLTRFANLMVIGLALSLVATGCQKKPSHVELIPGQAHTGVDDPNANPPIGADPGTKVETNPDLIPLNASNIHEGWAENPAVFNSYSVHFDYDSAAVKSAEKSKVASVADYLKGNAADAVRVEGNCDERGTEEYNRSLGERRALALREQLIALGIEASRIDTKSWGEDNPANDHGHNETAWRQNRRGDFILLTPLAK